MTAVVDSRDGPDLGPLRPPGDTTGLFGVLKRRYLLKLLVQKELRVRYQASLLGLAWSYVKPLVRFSMYFFVIGVLLGLRKSIPLFALHIFAAMIMVHFFTETLNAGTKSVIKNKSLVRKMNVPREMFPVASVMVTAYHAGPQYVILVIACLFLDWSPDPTAFVAAALAIAIMLTISLAVALAFSALNVSIRDFGNFVETVGMLVLWSAPQLYPYEFVADQFGPIGEQIYLANPVAIAVLLNQRAFWTPAVGSDETVVMPEHLLLHGGIMLVCCLGLVGVAQLVFSRLEHGFAEKM
jgi:ABC-type polysaccharide/polyol phosphate export permease